MRSIWCGLMVAVLGLVTGCGSSTPEYGTETPLFLPGHVRQTWAVAPVINLSGQKVDPILQADLVAEQLGKVAGLTPIPVNRVVEVYTSLRIPQVQTEEQAALVCDLLGCDALLVASVTAFDPYEPPKLGASLVLFRRGAYKRPVDVDPRELVRRMAPSPTESTPVRPRFVQVFDMLDASDGSTRAAALRFTTGRYDPNSPYGPRQTLVEMDRYCGFAYYSLIDQLLKKPGVGGE